jgi:Putative zinc-finger/HEAT repeats
MRCEQIGELLPDYLQGSLNAEQDKLVEQHLEKCEDCRDEVMIATRLSRLPVEQPSPASRQRFEAMLHAYQTGRGNRLAGLGREPSDSPWSFRNWLRTPVGALAWSAALLVIGIFAGNYYAGMRSASNSAQNQIDLLRGELASTKQLVVLSMLQQQSASERLQGVSYTRADNQLDPQIMNALLHTLRSDNSVDVRLAALDALSRHAAQPQVHKGVMDSLQEQQSPLVQVALIDMMLEWRDPDVAQQLRNFQKTPNLNPVVKQRAEWALSKLQ